ncbi:MAG: carbohydrate binding family 9 domain-containing protein [Gammaproteobacteria bacterium]|nr:carbohydrate binding family 9 domain-containing protein [Gammaproteobacteria bacterium]
MDEPAWAKASVIHLVQQDPHPNAPTPYRTVVRVLADQNHLYFGIECTDPDSSKIAVHTLAYDADQTNDDHITIVLDTFNNQKVGYVFQVNAGGARADGLISPASSTPDYNWNGIWNAAVRRTATGWTAEIAIDTRSLQFRKNMNHWGFNIQRYVPRDQLSLQWAGITLDTSIFNLQRIGDLSGVAGLEEGSGFEFSPYGLVRYDSVAGHTSDEVGAELRYNIEPDLAAILTVNPDFAEAEADAQQINLTQFPLYFPEKRPFFLEGSNQFTFAAGPNNNFIPFYSRQIGLVDGQTVRIDEGAKVVGEAGPWSIGALGVRTGQSGVSSPTDLFAGNVSYDLNERLRAGVLVTHGDPTGKTDNTFTGVDGVWQSATFLGDKNLTVSGWAGRSTGNLLTGQASGWGLYANYPNDLWNFTGSYNVYGDALDPALGFLPRPGTRQTDLYADYRPRPPGGTFGWVRQFFFQVEYTEVDALNGYAESKMLFTAPFNADSESGAHYEFDWIPEYQAPVTPFQIVPNVTIPVGQYYFQRYHFEAQSSPADPVRIGSTAEFGGFYNGRLTQITPFVDWTTFDGKLQIQFNTETDFGYLPEGKFIERLRQLLVAYSFSPDFIVSSFVQYDSTIGHTGVNIILHWIMEPGRDLYVVLNHGVEISPATAGSVNPPLGNVVIMKLRWDLRW